jgi:hypothetical protein
MNFNEINPGIVKIVAMLQANGFNTVDSGDGVTNVELELEDALEFPHVFMVVDPDKLVTESQRLYDLLEPAANFNPDVEMIPDQPLGTIEVSYSPVDKSCVMALSGLDDAFLFGPDPDLAKKRLGYQVRFCDAMLADPGHREFLSAKEAQAEHAFYQELRDTLAKQLIDLTNPHAL